MKINLLPVKVQKAKDVRRITIIIAAIQVAIFLGVIFLYVFFSMWGVRISREKQTLESFLRETPTQQAGIEMTHFFFLEEFLTKDALLNAQAVPNGIWIYAIRFNHGELSISAHTMDILNILVHMEYLGEFFYNIRLTSLAAADEGTYIYELSLR